MSAVAPFSPSQQFTALQVRDDGSVMEDDEQQSNAPTADDEPEAGDAFSTIQAAVAEAQKDAMMIAEKGAAMVCTHTHTHTHTHTRALLLTRRLCAHVPLVCCSVLLCSAGCVVQQSIGGMQLHTGSLNAHQKPPAVWNAKKAKVQPAPSYVVVPAAAPAPSAGHGGGAAAAAAAGAHPIVSSWEDTIYDVEEEKKKVIRLGVPLTKMRAMAKELEDLSIDSTPCFSLKADKDKPQVSFTKDGLALVEKSLKKQVENANAERIILLRSIERYMGYMNAACDQKYKLVRYTNELRVLEALRRSEKERANAKAEHEKEFKMATTKGFAQREAEKEALKRKKPTQWEERNASIFDLLKQ
jgi:hypothetical protein